MNCPFCKKDILILPAYDYNIGFCVTCNAHHYHKFSFSYDQSGEVISFSLMLNKYVIYTNYVTKQTIINFYTITNNLIYYLTIHEFNFALTINLDDLSSLEEKISTIINFS